MPLARSLGLRALRVVVVVVSLTTAIAFAAPAATGAVSTQASDDTTATALRVQAENLANQYFDALTRFQSLDSEIARYERTVQEFAARARKARADARARALVAYKTAGSGLSTLIDGHDSLDAARRARLIDNVNSRDQATYARLHAATRDLHEQQRALQASRQAQADALAQLRDQGAAIDAKLAQAEQRERDAAVARAVAAAAAAPQPAATPTSSGPQGSTAAPDPTTTAPPAPAPAPPSNYTGTPGTSPHHDDPYLACVRQRESSGNYSAVNPAGPYLGAYQFLQSTWNLTASHAARTDLVGVPANRATPYDQDEIAWALYQWQGTRPWGGSCP